MGAKIKGGYSSFEGYSRKELRHALKKADPVIFDDVLQFLIDDPRTFGSGYVKTTMWRCIRRYPLAKEHIEQLEKSALKYLKRPMRPEYKRMCQTMAHIASKDFWDKVLNYTKSNDPITQFNAYCLYQYSYGLNTGERSRLEMKNYKLKLRAKQKPCIGCYPDGKRSFYGKHVWEIVQDKTNWQNEALIYRSPDDTDLPIIRRGAYDKLAALDYKYCYILPVLNQLESILLEGTYYDISTTLHAWCYCMYVIGEIGSADAILIIEYFYEMRIEHQFESGKKWYVVNAICRALERINTPQSLELARAYQYPDTLLDHRMMSFNTGWIVNKAEIY